MTLSFTRLATFLKFLIPSGDTVSSSLKMGREDSHSPFLIGSLGMY